MVSTVALRGSDAFANYHTARVYKQLLPGHLAETDAALSDPHDVRKAVLEK